MTRTRVLLVLEFDGAAEETEELFDQFQEEFEMISGGATLSRATIGDMCEFAPEAAEIYRASMLEPVAPLTVEVGYDGWE